MREKWLDIPGEELSACFGRRPFKLSHRLSSHPLFELEALVDLACRNAEHVQWHRGDMAPVQAHEHGEGARNSFQNRNFPGNGLDMRQTIEEIEHCGSWMLIREIGNLPEYRMLMLEYMQEVAEALGPLASGMHKERSDVVISSPRAITPFHMDEEQNFLLQLKGWKDITIVDGGDRNAVNEADREAYYAANGELHPGRLDQGVPHTTRKLEAGSGVHIPHFFPHSVVNGDEVSVAVTTMFLTDETERERDLFRLKEIQRGFGLPVAAVGAHPRLDEAKLRGAAALRALRDRVLGRPRDASNETEGLG